MACILAVVAAMATAAAVGILDGPWLGAIVSGGVMAYNTQPITLISKE